MRLSFPMSRPLALALVAGLIVGTAWAQKAFEPQVGQPGKDVIWVPTPLPLVQKMHDLTKTGKGDVHFDLGSGDGRSVIEAAKRGADAHGVEYNPDMVNLSRENAAKAGVSANATFHQADLFQFDFSKANVITLYLLTSLNARLRPIILKMQPGTRVASNSFDMGDWRPDQTVNGFPGCQYCTAHYWMVPAQVEGTWKLPNGTLQLKQRYQVLNGSMTVNGKETEVTGRLAGSEITLTAGGTQYTGKVDGNAIRLNGGGQSLNATRG